MYLRKLSVLLVGLSLLVVGSVWSAGTKEAAGPQAITYWEMEWGPASTYNPAVQSLVDAFNKSQKNVAVTVQMTPWDNFYNTFLTAITAGAGPDASTGAFPQPVQYAQMGKILYLDSIMQQWKQENSPIPSDFPPGAVEMYQFKGHQAGIPWNLDPRQITYRTDLFQQAGITTMPKTWDDFITVCQTIKDKTGVIPFVFGVADQMGTQTILNFMFTNGTGIVTADYKPDFQGEKVTQLLQFLATLRQKGLVPDGMAGYKEADAERLYESGKAAMIYSGPPTYLVDYPDIQGKSAIMPPFAGPSGAARDLTWDNAIMAYSNTKHPDAAKTFIKWWMENNLPLWTQGKCGPLPARLSFLDNSYFTSNWIDKQVKELILPGAVTPVWPAANLYPQWSQIEGENYLALATQAVMTGQSDFTAIANQVQTKITSAFQQ